MKKIEIVVNRKERRDLIIVTLRKERLLGYLEKAEQRASHLKCVVQTKGMCISLCRYRTCEHLDVMEGVCGWLYSCGVVNEREFSNRKKHSSKVGNIRETGLTMPFLSDIRELVLKKSMSNAGDDEIEKAEVIGTTAEGQRRRVKSVAPQPEIFASFQSRDMAKILV